MASGGKKINKLSLYACGYCENHLNMVLRGEKKCKLLFPAMVVKIEHVNEGVILFDTGYSGRIYKNGVISLIYNWLNPTYVKDEDHIAVKLADEDILEVNKIILSHPHPDHIGALRDFNNYDLYASKGCFKTMENPRLSDLVFKNQLPDYKKQNIRCHQLDRICEHFLGNYFEEVYDILGDGSIIGVLLNGHSFGQIGIYISEFNVLFAADAAWSNFFANRVNRMRIIPRWVQNNYEKYTDTIGRIHRLKADYPEIKVMYSHQKFKECTYEPKT